MLVERLLDQGAHCVRATNPCFVCCLCVVRCVWCQNGVCHCCGVLSLVTRTLPTVEYNPKYHRIQLVHRFISKAGCDQRAGRTGRVRPGTVWRLYSKQTGKAMDEFDPPEIQQTPLEHVILQLKSALSCQVLPVLQNVISPPDLSHVSPAFTELHRMRYIESPTDTASLTEDGTLAAALGLDLKISQVVLYGIRLGIPREAVAVAAALSLDKLPFRIASPFVHTPAEMADITSSVVRGMAHFDAGMYSTPLQLTRVLHAYRTGQLTHARMQRYGLAQARVKRLHTLCKSIEMKMTKFVDGFEQRDLVDLQQHPRIQSLLRIALVWSFYPHLFKMTTRRLPSRPKTLDVVVRGDKITTEVVGDLLGQKGDHNERKHWKLLGGGRTRFIPYFGPGKDQAPTAEEWCTFIVSDVFANCGMMRLETSTTEPSIFAIAEKKSNTEEGMASSNNNRESMYDQLHGTLSSLFGAPTATEIEIHGQWYHSYCLPQKLSKSQKKRLKDIEERFVESSVHVRDDGCNRGKQIICKNVDAMDVDFLYEYFGKEDLLNISCTHTVGKMKIQFEVPPLQQETKEVHPSVQPSLPVQQPVPLLDDIPLGARTLLILASYNYRGCIKYPTLTKQLVGDGNTGKEFDSIRLTTSYRSQVEFLPDNDGSSTAFDDDSEGSDDEHHNGARGARGAKSRQGSKVLMERASLISVAHHMTTNKQAQECYGVAGAVMAIGDDASTMVMQQCSLTTPGRAFMHKALSCVRQGHRVDLAYHDVPLSNTEFKLIDNVAQELCGDEGSSSTGMKKWQEYIRCSDQEDIPGELSDIMDLSEIQEDDLYYFNVLTGEFIMEGLLVDIDDNEIIFMGRKSPNDHSFFQNIMMESLVLCQMEEKQTDERKDGKEENGGLLGRLEMLFDLPEERAFVAPVKRKNQTKKKREQGFETNQKKEKKKEQKRLKAAKVKKEKAMAKSLAPAQVTILKKAKKVKKVKKVSYKWGLESIDLTDAEKKVRKEILSLFHRTQSTCVLFCHVVAHLISLKDATLTNKDFKKKKIEKLNFVVKPHHEKHPSTLYCSMPDHDWALSLVERVERKGKTKAEKAGAVEKKSVAAGIGRSIKQAIATFFAERGTTILPFSDVVAHLIVLQKANKFDVVVPKHKKWFKKKQIQELSFVVSRHNNGHPSNFYCSMPHHDWSLPLVKYQEAPKYVSSYKFRCLECHQRFQDWESCKAHVTIKEHMKEIQRDEGVEHLQRFCINPLLRGEI